MARICVRLLFGVVKEYPKIRFKIGFRSGLQATMIATPGCIMFKKYGLDDTVAHILVASSVSQIKANSCRYQSTMKRHRYLAKKGGGGAGQSLHEPPVEYDGKGDYKRSLRLQCHQRPYRKKNQVSSYVDN